MPLSHPTLTGDSAGASAQVELGRSSHRPHQEPSRIHTALGGERVERRRQCVCVAVGGVTVSEVQTKMENRVRCNGRKNSVQMLTLFF